MIKEEDIQQQQVQSTALQRKTTKTQATQVHERERCENQSRQSTLRKSVHQGSIEEECLQKEPLFVNHYYSHPLGQCCCQQHNVSIKEDRITVCASTGSNQEKSENLRNSQQGSEARTCNNIMYTPAQNGTNEHEKKVIQDRNNESMVDPRVQFTQASVPNQRDTVPLYVVNTSIPPLLMMKKEKEEYQTNVKVDTETRQKDGDLLKVVQMVAESLQQQIVLGMRMADMSQQRTDALIGELIKSHNRRDMDHILNNIPTFNGMEPEKCVDWAMKIRNACDQSNRDFRQELMNKSELMVQNFIKELGSDISDDEVMNRILGFFSDIPTPYHAMDKIKTIKQNDEPMPQFNQKYWTYIKRLERKTVNEMTSHTQMGTLHERY